MFEQQLAWHARMVLHDIARLLLFPFFAAIPAYMWFVGAGRSGEDGRTRVVSSIALRAMATVGELATVVVFVVYKGHLVLVAKARPGWGFCAAVVLCSGVVLLSWAVLSHFRTSSMKLDILDGSAGTAKLAARFSRIEDLQTNASAAWMAGFSTVLFWLWAIATMR